MTGTLLRKTDAKKLTPTAALIGSIFWRAEKEAGLRKFKGYRLVNGVPEFRYFVDGVEVREMLAPEGGGIRRRRVFDPAGRNTVVEELLQ